VREYGSHRGEALSIEDIREGDVVHVDSLGYDAIVAKVMQAQRRLRVSAAGKEIEVSVSDVTMRTGKGVRPAAEERPETGEETVPSRINLIGLRVDEALSELEPFLNHASLAGFSEVTIIHGLGAGILARAVREHLAGHPLIKQFRPGEKSEGGNGVTVAVMT
jgi:DNA mismatch repair protein MutS2